MAKKVGVILSGCGFLDGAEIHEAVMTLYALQKHGADPVCYAPDIEQHHVVNHLTGEEQAGETRNVLVESARIARGHVKNLAAFDAEELDALALPGGFGAAKNLSNFAFAGPECTVIPEVKDAVRSMIRAGKPIAALCISPAIMARIFDQPTLTIGQDADTAAALEAMGAKHETTGHGEVVIDRRNKLVTTPCYMLESTVPQIAAGAENAIEALLRLTEE